MVNYYSVRIGKQVGIYLTWKECEENVKGYPNAKYKKFNTKEEAEKYLEEEIEVKEEKEEIKRIVNDEYDFEKSINVYTDGSCINNGDENAVGGYGVYFGENKENISKKLKPKEGYKITNNRAELKAILEGIKKLEKEIEEGKEVIIHTDSMYCIQVITSENTYKKIIKGKETPNSDYIKKIYKCVNEYTNIKFNKVLAHTGKKDIHSIGNENADRLANEAIKEDIGKIKISYGQYKGKTLDEIYEKDEKYLLWCIENSKNQKHDIELFLDTICNKNIQIKNKTKKESEIYKLEK